MIQKGLGSLNAVEAPLHCDGRACAGPHLRKGSLVCVHIAGGPPPPTASECAIGGGEIIAWPMQGCASASAGSLGKSMAKVPAGRGEKDSDGASPTEEQAPGDGMDGMGRDLKAVTTFCTDTRSVKIHGHPSQLTVMQPAQHTSSTLATHEQ